MPWPQERPASRYPSDLTDEEWEILQPIFEQLDPYTRGRPREVELREVVNAIFYLNKTGCQWRYLPKDFPHYTVVSYYYHKWVDNGTWEQINTALRERFRQKIGRNAEPSAAIIDSQTVKGTSESVEESGYDGGKKIKGRKRHIVVDTIGCVIQVVVHAANIHDSKAARRVLKELFKNGRKLQKIWADMGYKGKAFAEWVKAQFGGDFEVVNRKEKGSGFQVLPRRWVVERTFAWLIRSRRLSKDYERKPTSSVGQVYGSSIRLLLRKITQETVLEPEVACDLA
jgi:putative transposase